MKKVKIVQKKKIQKQIKSEEVFKITPLASFQGDRLFAAILKDGQIGFFEKIFSCRVSDFIFSEESVVLDLKELDPLVSHRSWLNQVKTRLWDYFQVELESESQTLISLLENINDVHPSSSTGAI